MSAVVESIISILTAGITGIGTSIGAGLSNLVQHIFVDTTGTTPALTTFGGVVVVFAGISLAIGLCTLVVNWVMNLGK